MTKINNKRILIGDFFTLRKIFLPWLFGLTFFKENVLVKNISLRIRSGWRNEKFVMTPKSYSYTIKVRVYVCPEIFHSNIIIVRFCCSFWKPHGCPSRSKTYCVIYYMYKIHAYMSKQADGKFNGTRRDYKSFALVIQSRMCSLYTHLTRHGK